MNRKRDTRKTRSTSAEAGLHLPQVYISPRSSSSSAGRCLTQSLSAFGSELSSVAQKRKIFESETPCTVIKKRKSGDEQSDNFCWKCHKLAEDEFICYNCPRTYHKLCLKDSKCECERTGGRSQTKNQKDFNKLLYGMLLEIEKNNGRIFFKWAEDEERNKLLCKKMDIKVISDKIDNMCYKNFDEIVADIMWIYHNCCITYGVDDQRTALARKFLSLCKKEIQDYETCNECYKEKIECVQNDFFIKICSEPHDIVWAKLKGYKFWPAKCLSIKNGIADVRFFGTHESSRIEIVQNRKMQVYRISQNNPEKNAKQTKNSNYNEAVEELKLYIENYRKQIGEFTFFPDKTPLVQKSRKRMNQRKSNMKQHEAAVDINVNDSSNVKTPCRNDLLSSTSINIDFNNEDLAQRNMDSTSYIEMTFEAENHNEETERNSTTRTEDSTSITSITSLSRNKPSDEIPIHVSADEDEVILLLEKKSENLVEDVFNDPAVVKILMEMSMANKPNIRSYIESMQSSLMKFLLQSWLNLNKQKDIRNVIETFLPALCRANKIEEENKKLRHRNEELAKENDKLQEESKKLKKKTSDFEVIKAKQNEKDLMVFRKNISKLRNELKQERDMFHSVLMNKEEELKTKTLQMSSLKEENEEILKKTKEIKDQFSLLVNRKNTLEDENKKLKAHLQACRCRSSTSNYDFEVIKAKQNEKDLMVFRKNISKLRNELKQERDMFHSVLMNKEEELKTKTLQMSSLKEENEEILKKTKEIKDQFSLLVNRKNTLEDENKKLKAHLQACRCRSSTSNYDFEVIKAKQNEKDLMVFRKNISELRNELKQERDRFHSVLMNKEEELKTKTLQMSSLKEENEEILKKTKDQFSLLVNRKNTLEDENKKLKAHLQACRCRSSTSNFTFSKGIPYMQCSSQFIQTTSTSLQLSIPQQSSPVVFRASLTPATAMQNAPRFSQTPIIPATAMISEEKYSDRSSSSGSDDDDDDDDNTAQQNKFSDTASSSCPDSSDDDNDKVRRYLDTNSSDTSDSNVNNADKSNSGENTKNYDDDNEDDDDKDEDDDEDDDNEDDDNDDDDNNEDDDNEDDEQDIVEDNDERKDLFEYFNFT